MNNRMSIGHPGVRHIVTFCEVIDVRLISGE
jgi:hypothetical protein